jgi:AraC family transcriptional regulator
VNSTPVHFLAEKQKSDRQKIIIMKLYIKNMVCKGTKVFVLNELERLGLNYTKFELGEIDFEKDLSSAEVKRFDQSLHKYGLEITFRKSKLVSDIRNTITELIEKETPFRTRFSYFISQQVGYNYAHLNKYFIRETGLPIEEYYLEKKSEKMSLKEQTWSDAFIAAGINV